MTAAEHARFTERTVANLAARADVLGVVGLGSTSGEGAAPDAWSDHDLFVVVPPGAQEAYRRDLSWLPDAERIVLAFRETAHGLKVVYGDGHLVEFAAFDPDELRLARVNRYRVLLDRADLDARLRAVRDATAALPRSDDVWLVGQLLTHILVGAGRWRRGERLAGDQHVRSHALGHLLRLAAAHLPAAEPAARDDLDPFRRVERTWPDLARELEGALRQDAPAAAEALLDLAVRRLGGRVDLPAAAVAAVRGGLAR